MVNGALHKLVLISYSCSDRQIMRCKNASGKIQISCSMGPPAPSCLLTRPIGFPGNSRVLVRSPSILLSASRQHSPYSPAHEIRPIGFVQEPAGARRRSAQWYRAVCHGQENLTQPKYLNNTACLWLTPLLHSPSSAHCPCRPAHMSMSSMSCLDVPAPGLWIWTQGTQASQDSLSGLSSICWTHSEFLCKHVHICSVAV